MSDIRDDTAPLPEGIARTFDLEDGTRLAVPVNTDVALLAFLRGTISHAPAPLDIMVEALLLSFDGAGLILVPRARSKSRNTVDADVYSLALSWAGDARRRLQRARTAFQGGPERGDLHAEVDRALRALTGHAPPIGVDRLAAIDERLRLLRRELLDIPVDAPAAEPPIGTGDAA